MSNLPRLLASKWQSQALNPDLFEGLPVFLSVVMPLHLSQEDCRPSRALATICSDILRHFSPAPVIAGAYSVSSWAQASCPLL